MNGGPLRVRHFHAVATLRTAVTALEPPQVLGDGWGYQGKTETVCEVAAGFEDAWLEMHSHLNPAAVEGTWDLHAPVAYVQTPVTAKPMSTCQAVLDFFGAPTKNMNLPQLISQVGQSLHDHGVKALILDDITRLRMHRADDQDTLDLLRAFMSMNVTRLLLNTAPATRTSGWGNTWRLLRRHSSCLLQDRVISTVPAHFTPSSQYFETTVDGPARPSSQPGSAAISPITSRSGCRTTGSPSCSRIRPPEHWPKASRSAVMPPSNSSRSRPTCPSTTPPDSSLSPTTGTAVTAGSRI
ncbi:AAA family ATPase [Streptomyces sp. NPDC057474]|uniref:AAA family ATPase n=1 Tax=Streptomyces sp. NPDC057474 TaxID=3346144 RepID=UPI0036CC86F3